MGSQAATASPPPSALGVAPSVTTGTGVVILGLWITTADLANLACIGERKARNAAMRCHNGNPWRKTMLQTRFVDGAKGQGGRALQIYAPSLPPDLYNAWKDSNPGALATPTVLPTQLPAPPTIDPDIAGRIAERNWKLRLIAPALSFDKGSHQRAEILRDLAGKPHRDWDGRNVTYTEDTLRAWCKSHEANGDVLPPRKCRADRGVRRSYVNRRWDRECPLPDAQKRAIAEELETYIRGLWNGLGKGERKVRALASTMLLELSKVHGWANASLAGCDVGSYIVRANDLAKKLNIKSTDAKHWHDKHTPRIKRNRPEYPLEIVVGDVHPIDIYMKREDGSPVTARMIGWLDVATGDLFFDLVILPKSRGINQSHIVLSFIRMVMAWGLPRSVYFDNGTEYKGTELIDGFHALQGIAELHRQFVFHVFVGSGADIDAAIGDDNTTPKPVTRAKPYNAQAKQIESVFGILEGYFSAIPGYIGGNRMRKKTQNIGKEPRPFPGDNDAFGRAIEEAVAFYRNQRQDDGKSPSPNEHKAAAIAAGWRPYKPDIATLIFAFSQAERRRVSPYGIEVGTETYQHDDIVPLIGEFIEIRRASWNDDFILWLNADHQPVLIPKTRRFDNGDRSGAKEQSRLVGIQNRAMRVLAKTVPKLDMVEEYARHNAQLPPPPMTPDGIPVALAGDAGRLVNAIRDGVENPPEPNRSAVAGNSFIDRMIAANDDQEMKGAEASDNAPAPDFLDDFLDRFPTDQDKETVK